MLKIIGFCSAIIIIILSFYLNIQLDQKCTGYLKRAADANSIEMAKGQLDIAIQYLEQNNITHGYTSVIYQTPDEDVEYWYNNLKSCQNELSDPKKVSTLDGEKLTLLKLRQTLIDQTKNGDEITYPSGLAQYPNNRLWFFLQLLAIGIIIALVIIWKRNN